MAVGDFTTFLHRTKIDITVSLYGLINKIITRELKNECKVEICTKMVKSKLFLNWNNISVVEYMYGKPRHMSGIIA